jgi:hypothetical protein
LAVYSNTILYYQKGMYRIKVKNSDVSKFAGWNGWARNES